MQHVRKVTQYGVQEDLREVFSDASTSDVTSALKNAMQELDVDGDGGVSLNELLRVGLAGGSLGSRHLPVLAFDSLLDTKCRTLLYFDTSRYKAPLPLTVCLPQSIELSRQ